MKTFDVRMRDDYGREFTKPFEADSELDAAFEAGLEYADRFFLVDVTEAGPSEPTADRRTP